MAQPQGTRSEGEPVFQALGACFVFIVIRRITNRLFNVRVFGMDYFGMVVGIALSIFLMYLYLRGKRRKEGLCWADLRMPRPCLSWRGALVAAIALSSLRIPLSFPGHWAQNPGPSKGVILNFMVEKLLVGGIQSPILEEMVFRGYMLSVLERRYGRWPACISVSLLFAVIHTSQVSRMGFLALLCIFLTGVLLTALTLQSGHIWDGVLLHSVWNIFVARNGILFIGNSMSKHTLFTYVTDAKMPIPICPATAITEPQIYYFSIGLICLMLFVLWDLARLQGRTLTGYTKGDISEVSTESTL